MSVSIVLLAYKEADNLRFLLPKIIQNVKPIDKDYEIIVIDSETQLDLTKDVCEMHKGVKYFNQEFPAFGGALKTAIKHANKKYFLILDADGSHNPCYIPNLYKMMVTGKYDVVIGSRYTKGGKSDDSKINIFMSKILNFCFRLALGIKAKDISTDFRIYKTNKLKELTLNSQNYNILQEILIKLKVNNCNKLIIGEVPIYFKKRKYGKSKRKLLKFIIGYIKSLFNLFFYRLFNKNRI